MQSTAADQVFRFPWRTNALIFSVIGLCLVWLCFHKYHDLFLAMLPLLMVARAFADCRRKIVISAKEIAYWPAIGSVQRIRLADVESIELGEMGEIFMTGPATIVPAAQFTLSGGVTLPIPLGIQDHQHVFDEIVRYWKSRDDARLTAES